MGNQSTDTNTLIELLKQGKVSEFNRLRQNDPTINLRGLNLSNLDLRKLDASNLDLRDTFLSHADLRNLDLSSARLQGTVIGGAKIAGTLFPDSISAPEITLSLVHGTRLREIS